jgi:hypothetical protein
MSIFYACKNKKYDEILRGYLNLKIFGIVFDSHYMYLRVFKKLPKLVIK